MIGTTLAQYRITAALGAGGMGEVWRAEDTRLGREVALKVLPDEFAQDPDRMARFEREARVLASLNHPNIAHLYGLETSPVIPSEAEGRVEGPVRLASLAQGKPRGGSGVVDASPHPGPSTPVSLRDTSAQDDTSALTFLVMELVEGEDLSERITRGPIPVDEAIPIALQIAEALEAAHEQGIVHRDLKPANIKLTDDGTVKVLDFGLAKAWETDAGDSSLSLSPTMTRHATVEGVILGTAAYMSPEQARGKKVDRRADIWAFGVVLWEMLTGHKLFEGETLSDVLASVLKETPSLDALPSDLPPSARRVVSRCLERDPRLRLQWIGDARIELERAEEAPVGDVPVPPTVESRRPRVPWMLAASAAAVASVLAVVLVTRSEPEGRVIQFDIPPPPAGFFHLSPDNPGPAAVSPDGRMIVFSGRGEDGVVHLWVRALDSAELRPLAGTEDARYPFWSPDSRQIGFFDVTKLRVIRATGGPSLALCDAQDGKGGTWNEDGVIVFAPSYNSRLYRVSSSGGDPTPVTELDSDRGDNSHRHPRFLPDGRHFLFMSRSSAGTPEGHVVLVGSLDGSTTVLPLRSPAYVEYASGHLLFARDRTLMARPFDAGTLQFSGEAFPVAEDVTLLAPGTVAGVFSASQNGILAFQRGRGGGGGLRLMWRDREGRELQTVGEPGSIDELQLSPDGTLAMFGLTDAGSGTQDIWIFDLRREVASRFTFSPGFEGGLAPTPDGKMLYFTTETSGSFILQRKDIGGSGNGEVVLESASDVYPTSFSPDGASLALTWGGEGTGYDIWILPVSPGAEPYPLIQTPFDEQAGMFSPDGRLLAYQSDESGRPEIYVTAFSQLGGKWQISSGGGLWPRWRQDGREILYHAPDGTLMAVPVEPAGSGLVAGAATALFNTGLQPGGSYNWALAPDGESILVTEPVAGSDSARLSVVVNWLDQRDER